MRSPHFSDDERRALIRTLTNLLNQNQSFQRRKLASDEALSSQLDTNQHRTDIGFHQVLYMQIRMAEEQRLMAEEQRKQGQSLEKIRTDLKKSDIIVIPKEEQQFTEDPEA